MSTGPHPSRSITVTAFGTLAALLAAVFVLALALAIATAVLVPGSGH